MSKIPLPAQTRILNLILTCIFLAAILETAGVLGTQDLSTNWVVSHGTLLLPCLAFALHGWWTLGAGRTVLFFLAAGGIGWAAEMIGVESGVLFGGTYRYAGDLPAIAGIPVLIPLYWCVFTYTSYTLMKSIFLWNPLARQLERRWKKWTVVPKVALEALSVVSIDLLVDPLMVREGNWVWVGGGAYAGIPLGNFIGWFIVAALICGVFHLLAGSSDSGVDQHYPSQFLLFPVIGYGLLALVLTADALRAELYVPAVVGFLAMVPWPIISLSSYRTYAKESQNDHL